MVINFLVVGKTTDSYIAQGIDKYLGRLQHYARVAVTTIPELKNVSKMTEQQIKQTEAELILKQFSPSDFVILLDEAGQEFTSEGFAQFLQQAMNRSVQQMWFVVGGAYGFAPKVYDRADKKLSLSQMTFSHQMVRLLFVEQLYRAHTIIKGEPYHHK